MSIGQHSATASTASTALVRHSAFLHFSSSSEIELHISLLSQAVAGFSRVFWLRSQIEGFCLIFGQLDKFWVREFR